MHGQQEVVCQLEAGGKLEPQLPNTVQEEQEDWRLMGEEIKLFMKMRVEGGRQDNKLNSFSIVT